MMRSFQNLYNRVYSIIVHKTKPITLGRWTTLHCEKQTKRRIDWSNHDHCGPCGKEQVNITKKMFDKYI